MALVYFTHKISHTGITTYKVFEGYTRNVTDTSKANLMRGITGGLEKDSTANMKIGKTISEATGKKIFKYCQKLAFYSSNRQFSTSKGKQFKFRVSFLTLTAPDHYTTEEINRAFERFLDYLTRTANCRYVYKKEVGEKNGKFHIHLMINNMVPYYIVSHKWKKCLMFENQYWPKYDDGKDYNTHSRIELPRSKRMVSAYISKYMGKGGYIIEKVGNLWGKSKVLDDCKEIQLIENDINPEEYRRLAEISRYYESEFVTFISVEWFKIKSFCPNIYSIFEQQYMTFCEQISLPQKFDRV